MKKVNKLIIGILILAIIMFLIIYGLIQNNDVTLISTNAENTIKLSQENCKIKSDNNISTIQKYNGNAETIVIDKNIIDNSTIEISQDAFLECTNLDTILIDKSLFDEELKIQDFEINEEYEDEQYIMYTTTKEYSKQYKQYLELTEEEKSNLTIIPEKYEVPMSALYTSSMEENYGVSQISEEEIPEKFDLRDIIDINVENQNPAGTCYAYMSLTPVETNLALKNNEYLDFSEVHLSALTTGYGGYFIKSDDEYYADKIGPVYESEWPMEDLLKDEKDEISQILYDYLVNNSITTENLEKVKTVLQQTKPKKYVKETVNIPAINYPKNNNEEIEITRKVIKKHIMENGALGASMFGTDMVLKNGIRVLNSDSLEVNHGVSIIGWDDNFSKENFPEYCKPQNDGAYLALNSYGEQWGENGTLWISYEDYRVETTLRGVISVEDISENITFNSMNIVNLNTNEQIAMNKIPKGTHAQVEIDITINEAIESLEDFSISIISPKGQEKNSEIVLEKIIEDNKAQVLLNFDTNILDAGEYKIDIEYKGEYISRIIEIVADTFDYYKNSDGTIYITNYFGNEKKITIPENFVGYKVIGITSEAFIGKGIESIIVHSNITYIEENIIDNSTTLYGVRGTYIEQYANINGYTFVDLNQSEIEGVNWRYNSEENKLYISGDMEGTPYEYLKNEIYKVEILEPTTTICEEQFYEYSNLTEIILPDTITTIGQRAFFNCSKLEEISIPSRVTCIDEETFYGCSNLKNIEMPEELTDIKKYAFGKCTKLNSIQLPEKVTNIGVLAFYACDSITNITIPNRVTKIEDRVFYECCNLESIEILGDVTSIGYQSFIKCYSLSAIEIPNKVETIGKEAFASCRSLTNVIIPEATTTIGMKAFYNCSKLASVKVKGITTIEEQAFRNCTGLKDIELPNVQKIKTDAFKHAKIYKEIENGTTTIQDVTLPDIIKRVLNENDIFSAGNGITISSGNLNEEKNQFKIDTNNKEITLSITAGMLNGLKMIIDVPSGIITYSETKTTPDDVLATLHLKDGETVINNGGENTYNFTENDTFEFKYVDINGESRTAIAKVENIDKEPIIVRGNPTEWTEENVILTVNVKEFLELDEKPYSFDGGESWQSENTKEYKENTNGIIILVKDINGNIYESEEINITKIRKAQEIRVETTREVPYNPYENIDTNELKVYIKYDNEDIEETTDYTVINGENLTCLNKSIEIQYNKSIDIKAEFPIEVLHDMQEPTCMNDGKCKVEGCTYIEDALGHTEVIDARIEPACTETGLTEGKHCSVCDTVIIAQTTIPAKGHTEVIDARVEPTCTKIGLTEGKHCTVCNEVLVAQEVIQATGHTEVVDEKVEPTCTEKGLTEGKHCSVCDTVLIAQTTIPAKGHTEVIDGKVEPTCTETGLTEGKHCSVCDTVITAQITIPAKGHTEVIDARIEPACTETGLTEGKHCSVCDTVTIAQTTIPAKGHTEVIDARVEPNCTETGLTEGKHCSVCNEILVAQEIIEKLGHNYENGKCTRCEYVPVNSVKYEIQDQYILEIRPNTTIEQIKSNIQSDTEIEILDKKGNKAKETDIIGTGYQLKTTDGAEYTLIVWGDFNGDGKISVSDLARASRIAVQNEEIPLNQMLVIDINRDGKIKVTDLAIICRFALQ